MEKQCVADNRRTFLFSSFSKLLVILAYLALTSCGGGGGGAATSSPSYSGLTTRADLDTGNAEEMALGSLYGGPSIDTIAPISLQAAEPHPSGASFLRSCTLIARTMLQNLQTHIASDPAPHPLAQVPINTTVSGNCGGDEVLNGTVDDQAGHYTGTLKFNNYCENGTTLSGQAEVSGRIDLLTFDITRMVLSFQTLKMSAAGSNVTVRGTYVLEGQSMTLNHHIRDDNTGKVYKIVDYVIQENSGPDWYEDTILSGRFYHPDYGFVSLATPVPFKVYIDDLGPVTGQLKITGTGGSSVILATQTVDSFEVRLDADGDGIYEWTSPPRKWSSAL